jgi:negative regulator of sigma-B (phosphoserine phosphatase)
METMTPPVSSHREHGVEWCVASRTSPGESVSGDQFIVAPSRDGVLLAVVDGLGHGDEATLAACRATKVLAEHANDSVVALMQECHRALRDTRGAAMTLLSIDVRGRSGMVLGVGNVEMTLVRARGVRPARESALLRNGVVGYQLPVLQASPLALAPGDVIVFATDGVREDFGDRVTTVEPLVHTVGGILAQKFRGTDDALVLGCRLLEDYER